MWDSDEPDLPDAARIVLILAPATTRCEACAELAGRGDRVLVVGYGGMSATGLRDRLEDRLDDPPPTRSIDVGDGIEHGDLTGQEIAIAEALSPDTSVCVDSLGSLLQFDDREPVFQFVHSLAERCAEASASMHFHLDPDAVDDRTVAALTTLMDAVLRVEDRETTVRPELTGKD